MNTGEVLDLALAAGAARHGDWSSCHSVAWDAGAPPTGGNRELTNQLTRRSYPLGIVVNRRGERFVDEGADYRNYTYARYGREILRQPDVSPASCSMPRLAHCCAARSTRAGPSPAPRRSALTTSPRRWGSTATGWFVRSRSSTPPSLTSCSIPPSRTAGPPPSARRSPTGAGHRHAAVPRICGGVRHHVHLRRPARRRRRARPRRSGPAAGCIRLASSPAACSPATVPAVADSPPVRCTAGSPAPVPSMTHADRDHRILMTGGAAKYWAIFVSSVDSRCR